MKQILLILFITSSVEAQPITNLLFDRTETTNVILALISGITNSPNSTNIFIIGQTNSALLRNGTNIVASSNAFNDFTISAIPFEPFTKTVSSKGIINSLSTISNDGAMYGPDTVGTKTMGIQEAINSLPQSSSNSPGGGTIKLGYGTFYITTNIYISNSTNVFSLQMEGSGIQATAIVGLWSGEVFRLDSIGSGQLKTLNFRDICFATTNLDTPTNIININAAGNGLGSGLSRGEVRDCAFVQWTRATNGTDNHLGAGNFLLSIAAPTDGKPNNICPLIINNGFGDVFSIEHCSFCYIGTLTCGQNETIIRDNMFQYCGGNQSILTNKWVKTDPRASSAVIYVGEVIPYVGNNNPKWYTIENNFFVGCSLLYYIKDAYSDLGLSGHHVIVGTHNEPGSLSQYIALDGMYPGGGNSSNLTVTSINDYGGIAGSTPSRITCMVVTNANNTDYTTNAWQSNVGYDNLFFVTTKTNGIYSSRDVRAAQNIIGSNLFGYNLVVSNTHSDTIISSNIFGTNIVATNIFVNGNIQQFTNRSILLYSMGTSFTTNTANTAVVMGIDRQFIKATGTVTLTGPSNVNGTNEQSIVIYIDPNSADRTLNIPTGWKTTDGLRTWIVGTTNLGVINIECYGGLYTNAMFMNLW